MSSITITLIVFLMPFSDVLFSDSLCVLAVLDTDHFLRLFFFGSFFVTKWYTRKKRLMALKRHFVATVYGRAGASLKLYFVYRREQRFRIV